MVNDHLTDIPKTLKPYHELYRRDFGQQRYEEAMRQMTWSGGKPYGGPREEKKKKRLILLCAHSLFFFCCLLGNPLGDTLQRFAQACHWLARSAARSGLSSTRSCCSVRSDLGVYNSHGRRASSRTSLRSPRRMAAFPSCSRRAHPVPVTDCQMPDAGLCLPWANGVPVDLPGILRAD